MSIDQRLESILFVATKPLTVRRLADALHVKPEEVEQALQSLTAKWNQGESGIRVLQQGTQVQFVSAAESSAEVTEYLKEEQAGELTRASLETLTIIAYRGPISKVQLDTIRGVNCSLILRNLLIKGLIESKTHKDKMQTSYNVTIDFLRHLGLTDITQLPDYEKLHTDQLFDQLLNPTQIITSEQETTETQNS